MTSDAGTRLGVAAARRLAEIGCCTVGPGLTGAELDRVEREYGFAFADDHRAFLAAGLPIGKPWPDWRDGSPDALREALGWPAEGVLFDVEHNVFWYLPWGERPTDPAQALAVARVALADVPVMAPVYGHRYLPAGRGTYGHPVLSMYQTDIIYYGADLLHYIEREFADPNAPWPAAPRATVPFWRDLL